MDIDEVNLFVGRHEDLHDGDRTTSRKIDPFEVNEDEWRLGGENARSRRPSRGRGLQCQRGCPALVFWNWGESVKFKNEKELAYSLIHSDIRDLFIR
jgi:hypothetical protein